MSFDFLGHFCLRNSKTKTEFEFIFLLKEFFINKEKKNKKKIQKRKIK